MIIDQRATIAAPIERAWAFVTDIPAVARCIPGMGPVVARDGAYSGTLEARVGPVTARLEGRVVLAEQDPASHRVRLDVAATDRRLGSAVNARITMQLTALPGGDTDLVVHTEATVAGKLGQLGQAVITRQADAMLGAFAMNLSRAVGDASA